MSTARPWDDTETGRDADVASAFGAELRATRAARGLTQAALAEAADLSVSAVSLLERGERQPSLGAAFRLSLALGMSRDGLARLAADRLERVQGAMGPATAEDRPAEAERPRGQ